MNQIIKRREVIDRLSFKNLLIGVAIGLIIGLVIGLPVGYIVAGVGTGAEDIADLQAEISDLEGQITTLQSQIDDKDSQIANLQSQIEELQQLVPPLTKGEWNTIITFTGSASRTTELFVIPSENWRINWTYTGGSLAVFGFFVYPEGETTLYVESLSTMGSSQSDVTYIYEGTDSFYVKLIVANIDEWTLTVEVFIPE